MFLVSLFILSVVLAVSSRLSSKVIVDQAKKASSQNLHDISEKLDMTFQEIETFSKMAIADFSLQEELLSSYMHNEAVAYYEKNNAIIRILGTFIKPRTKIESMSILDFLSEEVYSSDGQSALGELPSEKIREIREGLNQENLVVWGEPRKQISHDKEIWTVPIFMKIYNGHSGAPLGILETDIPLSLFSDFLSRDSTRNAGFYIIDKEGRILANHDSQKMLSKLDAHEIAFSLDGLKSPKIHNSALYETKDYGTSGWLLASVVSLDEISAASRPLMMQLLLLGILSLLITLLISYLLSNSITKPLRVMEQSMCAFKNPTSHQYVPVQGTDEVGRLAGVYNEMIDRIAASIEQNNAEQKQLRQYEFSLLQAQINPHFLNNILENISGLVELGREKESLSLIRDAASFYRSVLSCGEVMITVEREIEIAVLYLKIQNVRHDDRIHFHIDIEDSIKQAPIVKLTIQPLLENAIMHGFLGKDGIWEITIEGHREGQDAVLTIKDNGVGMDQQTVWMILEKEKESSKSAREHVGVYATHQRLVLAFGELYGLRYTSEIGVGTTVTLRLPREIPDA